jgi:ribosomal-protein-alanine N-acetyltransferase
VSGLSALDLGAVDRLAEVHASAFEHPWTAGDLADVIKGLGAAVLGVEDEAGDLRGFVVFQAAAGEAEILTLAVRPDARRRGVGAALVEAAVSAAAAAGAGAMWLEVAADNAAAIGLYHKAGFAAAGRRRGYYRRGAHGRIDAVVMRRVLNTGGPSAYSP